MVSELFKNEVFRYKARGGRLWRLAIASQDWSVVGRVVVSLTVLIVAIYIILDNGYPDATTKWAFSVVGLILGYWLK